MLTKYTITLGSTQYDVPEECLKNWDDIAFTLKRSDYSGVMRSFSTEFVFAGEAKDLLWEYYLAEGVSASASIAVYTFTDTHEWELRFSAPLDFSKISVEEGTLTVNALDNTLASLIKSKKSQKYEWPVADFETRRIEMSRLGLASYANYTFPKTVNPKGYVNALIDEGGSMIKSQNYIRVVNEVADQTYGAENRFFAEGVSGNTGITLTVSFAGTVRCYFSAYGKQETPVTTGRAVVSTMRLSVYDDQDQEQSGTNVFDDDITKLRVGITTIDAFVNTTLSNVASSVSELNSMAVTKYGTLSSRYNGIFGVVGNNVETWNPSYYTDNTIYEYRDGTWINKGTPKDYYQDREVSIMQASIGCFVGAGDYVCLEIKSTSTSSQGDMHLFDANMFINWKDPVPETTTWCNGIAPVALAQKIIDSIAGEGYTVTIDADTAGVLAVTSLVAGEELRQIAGAKIYATFNNFADFMEAVFGYTYHISGNTLRFCHRSSVFTGSVKKTIDEIDEVVYSVEDSLIYATVEAGYSKKEYGEINGRYETNFTNYYSTGYGVTDKKLSLISKFRTDSYGVEFTMQKGEDKSEDNKADEDVFCVRFSLDGNDNASYDPEGQTAYAPSVCAVNNKGYIAALGNGKAVTLTMTSSDGDNALADITISAGDNLFTVGELEFKTDDMDLSWDLSGLVQVDHNGYRYKGYIKEAECRYGRLNGTEYKLIVKEITAI